jgi:hypothetical protein
MDSCWQLLLSLGKDETLEIKVYLSCNNSVVGAVSPCVEENEGHLNKMENVYLTFIGEEAEVLKSYFTNSENLTSIS